LTRSDGTATKNRTLAGWALGGLLLLCAGGAILALRAGAVSADFVILAKRAGAGEPYQVEIIDSRSELEALGLELSAAEMDAVDWSAQLLVRFVAVKSSGLWCPMRRPTGYKFANIERIVSLDFSRPPIRVGCNDDAFPVTFIVAFNREDLPPPPFRLRVYEDGSPTGPGYEELFEG
jgi:hypothetical protein